MNRLQLNSTIDDDSLIAIKDMVLDEIDLAILKCREEQGSLKNVTIEKLRKGLYRIEKREYQFKVLPGNSLAIKLHAGFVFVDCLVHFDEEVMLIVK